MQIHFDLRQKFRLLGPNQLEVVVSVNFSKPEKAIIAKYDLEHLVIVERTPTIFKDFNNESCEIDNNIYLGKFLRDSHAESVTSANHAKAFEREMLLALEHVKSYFSHNTTRYPYHGKAYPNGSTAASHMTGE